MSISTEKTLAKALDCGDHELRITGALETHVRSIRRPDSIVWKGVAGALITIFGIFACASYCSFMLMNPAALTVISTIGGGIGLGVIAVLGGSATVSAVKIGVAGKGINTLNELRSYREIERGDDFIVLQKRT